MGKNRTHMLVGCLIMSGAAAFGGWLGRPIVAAVIVFALAYLLVEFAAWGAARAYGERSGPP